jgi:6-phosphogluconolactonase
MTASFRLWSMAVVGLLLVPVSLRAEFVYVPEPILNIILAYRVDDVTGSLTPVPGSPFPGGGFPESMAVDLLGRFAYVTNINTVWAYRIGHDGALTPVPGSPFPAGSGPISLAVDLFGRFVYVANQGDNTISAYGIGSNGALTPVPGSPFTSVPGPISMAVDPLGRTVYVANLVNKFVGGSVSAYRICHDGALVPVSGSPFPAGVGPFSVAVDLLGRSVYVANAGGGTVSSFRIGLDGALTPTAEVSLPGVNPFPASVAVDAVGRVVYLAEFDNGAVAAYHIGATGALMPVIGSPFEEPGKVPFKVTVSPNSLAVDLLGRFAYTTNEFAGVLNGTTLSVYQIVPDGALTPVAGSPFHISSITSGASVAVGP